MMDVPPPQPRRSGRDLVRAGAAAGAGSLVLLVLPAVVPLGGAAKYVVVPGLIGLCFGLGCILNGVIDRWKRRE